MTKLLPKSIFIIGAGAAGIMTAISAATHGAKDIFLINATSRPGLKILMSGGGRCNITNAALNFDKFYGESSKAIRKIILQFPPEKVIQFFKQLGLQIKREDPWNKYFPKDDCAQSVLDCLLDKLDELGISFSYPIQALDFSLHQDKWLIKTNVENYIANQLVIASGGFSYPHTGSDGTLWPALRKLKLELAPDYAALTPIKTGDQHAHKLSGISHWCKITVRQNNKVVFTEIDSMLFTHGGLSGPGILNASQWFTVRNNNKSHLQLSFLPQQNSEQFSEEIKQMAQTHPKMKIVNKLAEQMPKRLAEHLIERAGCKDKQYNQLSKQLRKTLLQQIFQYQPTITGHSGYKKAEVTAGGIRFSELDIKTMAVKRYPTLYAVGEIVNVHGAIGGYNFQWAWSSGWVCGKGLAEVSKKA